MVLKTGLAAIPALEKLCSRPEAPMAETSRGKKFVKVKPYTRVVDGKKIRVGPFDRSTPKTSKGKKK
jgi:hypothetical protein